MCKEGSIRLNGSEVLKEGHIEVCLYGQWGKVCADGWDDTDATVVCRQLGLLDHSKKGGNMKKYSI